LMTLTELTDVILETEAERSWAATMGADFRRAWETAPTPSILVVLAYHLTASNSQRQEEFFDEALRLLGADEPMIADVRVGLDALRTDLLKCDAAAVALLPALVAPGLAIISQLPAFNEHCDEARKRELADALRQRVSYDSLVGDAS
jgi:hypothetical protein